jgi:hypothetical protein
MAARWDKMTKSLIEGYLQFWDEVGQVEHPPRQARFIIFLVINYPYQQIGVRQKPWSLKSIFKGAGFDKKITERDLMEIEAWRTPKILRQTSPTFLLDELHCVEWSHVEQWVVDNLDLREVNWGGVRRELELIDNFVCRPMDDIEPLLKKIQERFQNK